jgi:uncharacterized protein YfaA (DUF2138 family)
MFRTLLAHSQEVQHKRHLVYCVRVMSFGYTRFGVELVPVRLKVGLLIGWFSVA